MDSGQHASLESRDVRLEPGTHVECLSEYPDNIQITSGHVLSLGGWQVGETYGIRSKNLPSEDDKNLKDSSWY